MSQSTIAIDSSVYKSFSDTYVEPAVGLVIGARTENGKEYYVAHFAETLEDISDPSDENKSEASDSPPATKKTDIHSVREQTVAFHGKQVLRMLPGGLYILGIFIVEKEKNIFMRGKLEMKIKSILNFLSKASVHNNWYDAKFESTNELLVIHYEPSAKAFTARNIEVGQGKVSELKIQQRNLKWEKIECEFDTVGAMHVYKQAVGIPIKKNLQTLMKTFQESLRKATILIGGRFPSTSIIYQERDYSRRSGSGTPEPENNISDLEDEYFGHDDEDLGANNDDSAFDTPRPSKGRATRSNKAGGRGDGDKNDEDAPPEDLAVSSMSMTSKSGKKKTTSSTSSAAGGGNNGALATSAVCILFEKMPGILRSESPTPEDYEQEERGNGGSGRSSSSSMGNRKREHSPNEREHEFIHHLHLQGKICVVAYVPEGSSTQSAAESLRRDIIRSMASRIEMHCESLIDEEQTDESLQVYHEMPRRVFYQIPGSNIMVSDYLFPGEVAQDSIFSLQDLLSLQIQDVKDIMDQKELPIGDSERSGIKGSVEELLQQAENASKLSVEGLDMRTKVILFLVFFILVILLAVVVPFYVGRPSLPINQKNVKSDL